MSIYLEISGRRSGKTTRLLEEYSKSNPENSYIVVPNYLMGRHLLKGAKFITVQDLKNEDNNTSQILLEGRKPLQDYTLFWDEFDYGEDGTEYIKSGDYYSTTPIGYRTVDDFDSWATFKKPDMLLSLVHRRPNYDKFIGMSGKGAFFDFTKSKQIQMEKGVFEYSFEDFIRSRK